jgi:transcriptional regulator with GAF, ATPase, and Fis domain
MAKAPKQASAPKTTARKAAKPAPRKSRLTLAAEDAQRGLLLRTLRETGWNLSAAAAALDLTGAADVIRVLKLLAPEDYAAARRDGHIKPGRPKG